MSCSANSHAEILLTKEWIQKISNLHFSHHLKFEKSAGHFYLEKIMDATLYSPGAYRKGEKFLHERLSLFLAQPPPIKMGLMVMDIFLPGYFSLRYFSITWVCLLFCRAWVGLYSSSRIAT